MTGEGTLITSLDLAPRDSPSHPRAQRIWTPEIGRLVAVGLAPLARLDALLFLLGKRLSRGAGALALLLTGGGLLALLDVLGVLEVPPPAGLRVYGMISLRGIARSAWVRCREMEKN